ncbi:MAG: S41 family peptidase, partial [Acidobacteria bacterium]|nr:S41 family peptidase [Acidobacteriota bacterium]
YKRQVIKIDNKSVALQLPCLEAENSPKLKDDLNTFSTIILDLRFCASDDINSALRWAGFLFGKGEVKVLLKGGEKKINFEGEGILLSKKCYILADSTTARGGEILVTAGSNKFQVIGAETFGFAAEHQMLTLRNGDKLIILSGYFLNKKGEEIKDNPIKPDAIIDPLPKERQGKNYLETLKKLNCQEYIKRRILWKKRNELHKKHGVQQKASRL